MLHLLSVAFAGIFWTCFTMLHLAKYSNWLLSNLFRLLSSCKKRSLVPTLCFKQINDSGQMLRNAINILKINKATNNKCTEIKIIWIHTNTDRRLLLNWKRNKHCNTTRDIQILLRFCKVVVFQTSKQNEYVRKIASLANGFSFLFVFHHGELVYID